MRNRCVFACKMRLGFILTVNLFVTPANPARFLMFSQGKCVSYQPARFLVFSSQNASCVQCDCKFTCDAVDRSHIPCLFPQKMHFARILPHSLGSPFSGNPRLAFRSDCEFTCDAANCSLIPNIFPRKTHQEGFLGVVTAIANFHSHPSQEESQILTKEHCTGDVGLFDSQFLTNRGSLL